jgi:hypothetical protein
MAKKIIVLILFALALPYYSGAQEQAKDTLLNRMLVLRPFISPAYMFNKGGLWNSYFHASLEWCFDNRVSINADGSYFFSTQGDYKPLKMNHSLLLGAFYHFPTKSKVDFYCGIQPGVALVQQNTYTYNDSTISHTRIKATPLITCSIGLSYFFWKYMHLYAGLKYTHGTLVSQYGSSIQLDELMISAGLGFQLQFTKKGGIKK